jgi:PAS domain S-box-containing protein
LAAKRTGKDKFRITSDRTSKSRLSFSPYKFHIIMALTAVVILVGGYLLYYFQEQQMRQRIEGGLSVMSQLKVRQIADWRSERLASANILVGSPFFTEAVQEYIDSPTNAELKDKIIARLDVIQKAYPYQDILLTDIKGDILLSTSDNVQWLSDATLAQLPVATKEHKAVLVDFHYPPDSSSPHLDVVAPIFRWGQDSQPAVGAVVFCIDPHQYLYPLLQSSPTPSQTAETLLVERDGDHVLYLNELRFQKDTALKLRIPLSQQDVPAVMAVQGKEGVVEGRDYRGVEVLAALNHVPDSPWYTVTKIDTSEGLATWRARSGFIIAFVAGLLAAALAVVGLIWQRRQRLAYQALYQAEAGRKKLEQDLIDSEVRYRRLFETARDAILILDGETGQIEDANPFIKDMLGYTLKELKGKHLWEIGTFRDIVASKSAFDELKEKGYIRYEHLPLQSKDGRQIDVEFVSNKYKVDSREVFQCNIRDITERKRAEETLRESEEKYRDLVETMPDVVFAVDENGAITYLSPAIESMTGYNVSELMGHTFGDFLHPEDLALALEDFQRTLSGQTVINELRFFTKSGKMRWLRASNKPILVGDHMIGVHGVFSDITERKQVEEFLRQSEERYRTILEGMDDSYYEVDLAGNFTFVNDSLCHRLGHSREELIGMNYRAYTPAESSDATFKTFNRVYRTSKPVKGVPAVAISKDGGLIFTERSVFPLRDDKGEIIGFRGISRDITGRKLAEEERKQLELKAQITSRLASVGEMAAGVAHEINNPLTGITGYAQLLMDRKNIPPDIRSDLVAINDGAQRVAGIVQRLLAFSRQTKPERKLVDINELIESTLILRAYHLKVNNIEVITKLAPDFLETVVDPGQIQQVLLNLIVNAETEMKLAHGKGKLTITTDKRDNTVKVSVKDNGPGIKPEIIDRIFDPFFTTREVGQGTGLGLSLCYGIITEHNGKIYARSQPGKGATFIVELPIITEVKAPKPAEVVVKKRHKKLNGRILVVDDEKVVRDVVNRVLTGDGHKVESVDNAADALKKIETEKYDLILLDVKMPGTSGVQLYKNIQKIAKPLAQKVVFMTGDIMGADTERFLSRTRAGHIEKPFNAEQLKRTVNNALSNNV